MRRFFSKRLQGKYYDNQLVANETKSLKRYFARKGFLITDIHLVEDINDQNKKISLSFSIQVDRKRVFVFFGNHFFSDDQLRDRVLAFGRSAWSVPLNILSDDIIQLYHSKGFWQAYVEAREEDVHQFFIVKEGDRVSLKEIEIKGFVVPSDVIDHVFKKCLKVKYFDGDLLRDCLDEFVACYVKRGYLDFKVIKQEFELIKDAQYRLILWVDEGKQLSIGSVTISPLHELEHEKGFEPKNEKRVPFDWQKIQKQRNWLINYLQTHGYIYSHIKPNFNVHEDMVDIVWNVEGLQKPVLFGKTIIVGDTKYPFDHIMRELNYQEGDIWSKKKLEESISRLRDLKIFETVQLTPYHISEAEEKKDVILKLVDDDPFEIKARAGFQLVSKYLEPKKGMSYKAGSSFLFKNPFNHGGHIGLDFDFTRFYKEIRGYYRIPWIFNMPISTIIKGYNIFYDQPPYLGSKKTLYQAVQQGGLVGFSHKTKHMASGINLGVEWMETTDVSVEIAQAIDFSPALINVKVPYFFFEPNILVDFLNDNLNPSHGSFTVVSLKGMFPLTHDDKFFIKLLVEQSLFGSFSTPLVFACRLRFGHIFNKLFAGIMPPERFYLGGAYSLRSYEPDFAPPLGKFLDSDGKEQYAPQGGRTMLNMNFEVRFPLFFGKIGGVVFQDFGVLVGDNFADVLGDKMLAGTGVGLRYATPIGSFRFDIGWKWKKRYTHESSFAWFLTLGQAF